VLVVLFELAINYRLTTVNLSRCGVICMQGYIEDEDGDGPGVVYVCVDR
jgi:hypothetical protein